MKWIAKSKLTNNPSFQKGELPPYFMARGARLSGYGSDDEEMQEFEELQKLKERPEDMSLVDRAKLSIEKLVEKVGFFAILLCASVSIWLILFYNFITFFEY